jgi:hypothetical protein
MWKETLVFCLKALFQHFARKMKKYEMSPARQTTLQPRENKIKTQITQIILGYFIFIATYNPLKIKGQCIYLQV